MEKGARVHEVVAVAIILLSVGIVSGTTAMRGDQLRQLEDKSSKALDSHLVSIDGEGFSLSDFKGRPVLLDLMATWCVECRAQMPMLVRLHQNASTYDLVMISVDLDWFETDDQLREFRDGHGANWTFAVDSSASVYGAFFPEGFPTLILIDKDGKVVARHTGGLEEEELRDLVDANL